MRRTLLFSLLLVLRFQLAAQINLTLTVDTGMVSTECTDFLSSPDPMFGLAVAGEAAVYYPEIGNCFTAWPNEQWSDSYTCPAEIPTTVEVCLRVFENDALGFEVGVNCDIDESCLVTLCENFNVPPPGQSVTYTIMAEQVGASSGSATFTLALDPIPFPDNDLICNAVDLGVLPYGDTIGNAALSAYTNACGTNLGEPNPASAGSYFTNEAGVWFRFNSGPSPSGFIAIDLLSDPQGLGAPIDIEAAPYISDNGQCDGNLTLAPLYQWETSTLNNYLRILCPMPNTDYYILVDGDANNLTRGIFGIQVWDAGVPEGGDLRCEFTDLGEVPEGGTVSSGLVSNYCATSAQDPFFTAFQSQHSVWFRFVAPASGHVIIDGISDRIKDSIGVQLALFRSFNNTCTGFYSHVASQYTFEDMDESMEVTCLIAGRPYFVLVDGDGGNSRGIFDLRVTDAGDITPVTTLDTVVCAGGSVTVNGNTYSLSGNYADTINIFQGCDSIVLTNLTVLEPISATVEQTGLAIGLGGMSGVATATPAGGDGNYNYLWCSGETTATATQLPGGDNCCVTVTDGAGCSSTACFTVDYTTAIIPTFANDTLLCNGDTYGILTFSAVNGLPPYTYQWQNADGSLSGSGNLTTAGEEATLNNLPAGAYTIAINDDFFDTTFVARVVEPTVLDLNLDDITDASCFGLSDGSIMTSTTGGTPPYQYAWTGSGSTTGQATGLPAGSYSMTLTDDNGCTVTLNANVDQPAPFIATPQVVQEVSCFGGSDGSLSVTTNGMPTTWQWSNGGALATLTNLATGDYTVTVTNSDGCRDTAMINLPQPAEPLGVSIAEVSSISCFGAADGVLEAEVTGPFVSLTYAWSDGQTTRQADQLDAGTISLQVANEKGCTADANYLLTQPDELLAEAFKEDINCVDGPNAGLITIENVSGGTPGYQYALEGQAFSATPLLEGLTAGAYVAVVRDAAGCELALPVSILPPPEITVDLGSEETIFLGDSILLLAETNSDFPVFHWSHADSLSGPEALVRPLESTFYLVEVVDSVSFCRADARVRIIVDRTPRVYVPNAFSPNGDGDNDRFYPFAGPDVAEIATFRVFSRGGQLVFERSGFLPNDPNLGWDGTFQGRILAPQVLVYYLEARFLDGREEVVKGDV
ncbi:MAG: gliding motility-associated C-terminal domain-containing protein, partial [Lewinella sp.]|nr:gliding motility-associated C-terminal domain-containing protein [Lewinella sp.]